MNYGLFEPIVNSEDEMILRAGIKNKYDACTYLRAYIMASLCFEPQLVVSDSAVNLNRAFRTLIDHDESARKYKLDFLPKADFDELIRTGHIQFAARDIYKGNFSERLRETQMKMMGVDKPSEKYARYIDEICSDEYVHWYNLDELSRTFTYQFRDSVKNELNDRNISPEREKLLKGLMYRLAGKETITYNEVKSILLGQNLNEKSPEYRDVRKLLRESYDYNVPKVLKLDYCRSFENIRSYGIQDWKLDLVYEKSLQFNFVCDVYGLAALPVDRLEEIWKSKEYMDFESQVSCFRNGTIELDEYMEVLGKYLLKINDVVRNAYTLKNNINEPYSKGGALNLLARAHYYFNTNEKKFIVVDVINKAWNVHNFVTGLSPSILIDILLKALSIWTEKSNGISKLPEAIKEAIVLQNKAGSDSTGKSG